MFLRPRALQRPHSQSYGAPFLVEIRRICVQAALIMHQNMENIRINCRYAVVIGIALCGCFVLK